MDAGDVGAPDPGTDPVEMSLRGAEESSDCLGRLWCFPIPETHLHHDRDGSVMDWLIMGALGRLVHVRPVGVDCGIRAARGADRWHIGEIRGA